MAGGIFLLAVGLLVAFIVGYLIYIEIVVPPYYQAKKDRARKNEIHRAKLWETKRRKSTLGRNPFKTYRSRGLMQLQIRLT